jgi:hypothetical protein
MLGAIRGGRKISAGTFLPFPEIPARAARAERVGANPLRLGCLLVCPARYFTVEKHNRYSRIYINESRQIHRRETRQFPPLGSHSSSDLVAAFLFARPILPHGTLRASRFGITAAKKRNCYSPSDVNERMENWWAGTLHYPSPASSRRGQSEPKRPPWLVAAPLFATVIFPPNCPGSYSPPAQCLLLALGGQTARARVCPLLGVKQT